VGRRLSLRQIEGFLAIMEAGTVIGAAGLLNISQPAVSKLLAYLEAETGILLFDRQRGRLVPTRRGLQLHEEVTRVFGGLHQIEQAIAAIRREDRQQLNVGAIPALSGPFIQQLTSAFLSAHPDVYISIQTASSAVTIDRVIDREIDLGLISSPTPAENIVYERILHSAAVCVMPAGHRLATLDVITPADLAGEPTIAFDMKSQTQSRIAAALASAGIAENVVLDASTSATVCEFVAAGHGVSLMHPLLVASARDRVEIRPFEPAIGIEFYLCSYESSRHGELAARYVENIAAVARAVTSTL
jgi:DNA-binding transcriptional LysR family regulator